MFTIRSVYHAATALATLGLVACQKAPPASQDAVVPATPAVQELAPRDHLLLAAAKTALPPEDFDVANLPDPTTSQAQLLVTYCGQCHGVPAPSMHSSADWPSVVRRMWLRMERLPDSMAVAVPDVGQRIELLNYIIDNSLRVSGASLPEGQGRHEYAEICSRCHALPDPTVHSPEDWPAVFLRMERNMERMNVTPATAEQATRILLYLDSCCSSKN